MTKRLLIVVVAALVALTIGLTTFTVAQVPTATPIGGTPIPPAPTIFYVTTLVPTPTVGCPPPLPLGVGYTAYISGGVYVRNSPTASSPWVNYYQEAVTVTITDGPICDGTRYNWWRVSGPGNDGWVAEGSTYDGYWMRVGPAPAGVICPEAIALTVGQQTRLLAGVRVRQEPGRAGLVLTVAPADTLADVLDGPTCVNGYNWWQVQLTVLDVTYTGWIADGLAGLPLVIDAEATPEPECAPPSLLRAGGQAYVQYTDQIPKNMRALPDLQSELVATLLDGIGFTILDGPVCADGYNWWQIQILSRPDVSGWLPDLWISMIKPEKFRPT
ncbi:MAG: hypothetical protein JNJ78_17590 [Anaerolineae bacterium]|nr:hypothetical protein [Anaerolineae bacterium]